MDRKATGPTRARATRRAGSGSRGRGWLNPGVPQAPVFYDVENWFVIGSGWNTMGPPDVAATVRTSGTDGHPTAGSNVITSSTAGFALTDVGGNVGDTLGNVPPGAIIMSVSGNSATLNAYCRDKATNDSFKIQRATEVPGIEGVLATTRTRLTTTTATSHRDGASR